MSRQHLYHRDPLPKIKPAYINMFGKELMTIRTFPHVKQAKLEDLGAPDGPKSTMSPILQSTNYLLNMQGLDRYIESKLHTNYSISNTLDTVYEIS